MLRAWCQQVKFTRACKTLLYQLHTHFFLTQPTSFFFFLELVKWSLETYRSFISSVHFSSHMGFGTFLQPFPGPLLSPNAFLLIPQHADHCLLSFNILLLLCRRVSRRCVCLFSGSSVSLSQISAGPFHPLDCKLHGGLRGVLYIIISSKQSRGSGTQSVCSLSPIEWMHEGDSCSAIRWWIGSFGV